MPSKKTDIPSKSKCIYLLRKLIFLNANIYTIYSKRIYITNVTTSKKAYIFPQCKYLRFSRGKTHNVLNVDLSSFIGIILYPKHKWRFGTVL